MDNSFKDLSGKSVTMQKQVARNDTYDGLLSTAALTRYMLETAWALLDSELHEGVTSVAAMVQVTHEEPTVAGEIVTVEATVKRVEKNRVSISMKAVDETGVIAHGLNERLIVDKISLKHLADQRAAALKNIL